MHFNGLKRIKERFRYRTLQVNILSVFLSLLILSFSITLVHIYTSNKATVVDISNNLMKQVSTDIVDHLTSLLKGVEDLVEIEKGLIVNEESVSLENKELLAYMMDSVKLIPDSTTLRIATVHGNSLGVFTLQPGASYNNDPTKLLPEGYVYAVHFHNSTSAVPSAVWVYKDMQGKTIEVEHALHITYNARTKPWFIGAEKTGGPFWTSVYAYALIGGQLGISFGDPVYDINGKLIAVAGGDIQLSYIDTLLNREKITPHTVLAILTEEGKMIVPHSDLSTEQVSPMIARAYHEYQQHHKESFLFDDERTAYLASVVPYRMPSGDRWFITVVIPEEDFLMGVLSVQRNLYIILFVVIVIASWWVAIFAKAIAKPIVALSEEVHQVQRLELEHSAEVQTNIKEIRLMQAAISAMKSALISFERYIPKEVVRKLLKQGKEITLGGERKEIVIFFSHIQDFTTITEGMPAGQLGEQLSIYFEKITQAIFQCEGTLDKYIGDGVMAFWGAPTDVVDAPAQACRAALLAQQELALLNELWIKEGKPPFYTRMGLHVGSVIVGNIGTLERMNYTVIGDPVNLASRLEGVNEHYHTKIIISEEMHQQIGETFSTRLIDTVTVKGKAEPVKIFELLDVKK